MRLAVKIFNVRGTEQGQPTLQLFQIVLGEGFISGKIGTAGHTEKY
jgi:hypothetical protein